MHKSDAIEQNKGEKQFSLIERLESPALWLAGLVFLSAILFYMLNIQSHWDSPTLTLWLNVLFVVIPCFFVSFIATRGFLFSGLWSVLSLGIGSFSYGSAALLSMGMRVWAPAGASQTVFALVYLVAGLSYFLGALSAINGISPQPVSGRRAIILQLYLSVLAFIVLAAIVSIRGFLPPFFIQGVGSTTLRMFVQGIAIVLFSLSGLIILIGSLEYKSAFLKWYGLGLLLAVLNTFGVLLIVTVGTPFHWILNISQLLGGVYLFAAAITIVRESRIRQIPTGEFLTNQLALAKARLKDSEKKYSTIVSAANEGIWLVDAERRTTFINDKMAHMLGYSVEEIMHISWREMVTGDGKAVSDSLIEKRNQGTDTVPQSYDLELFRKDGTRLWVTINSTPLYDNAGSYAGSVSMLSDITERKKAEKALKESEEKYHSLFETMNEGFILAEVVTDGEDRPIDYRFLDVNSGGERFFGRPRSEIIGQTYLSIGGEKADREWIEKLNQVALTGNPVTLERYAPVGGQWVLLKAYSPRRGQFAAVFSNITERKKAEEALKESERYSAFLIELTDALKPLSDTVAIEETASRLLGEHLKADRVGYFKIEGGDCVVERDYAPSVPHLYGRFPVAAFGERLMSAYQTGRMVVMNNIAEELLTPEERESYIGIQVQAQISIPLIKNGEFLGGMTVHSTTPRVWTPREKLLLEETAERTWVAIELKKAEEALKESEDKYRTLFTNITEGFELGEIILDVEGKPVDYKFLEVNPAFETISGLSREKIIDKRVKDAIPGVEAFWIETFGKVALTGQSVHVERYVPAASMWLEVYVFCNQPGQFAALWQDITGRKKAEEEKERLSREATDRLNELQTILDEAPFAIWIARDPDCRVITGNIYANQLFGVQSGDNISRSALNGEAAVNYKVLRNNIELKPEDLPAQVAASTGKEVAPYETELIFENGKKLHMLLAAQPLIGADGKVRGSVAVGTNITEQKQAMAIKDEFISMVSHELKTPITVIMGALSTATDERVPQAEAKQLIEDAIVHSDIMANLIENLLELSRQQSGRLIMQSQPVNISEITRSVIKRLQIKSTLHQLTDNLSPGLPLVSADPLRVERIIYNLVDNAIKYSPDGGEVKVSVHQEGDMLVISVSDQGLGISREDQSRLFQSFERLGARVNGSIQGTGLGLRVCRILTEAQSGKIWVESEKDKGSTFFFTLPIAKD
jgi:PAS domain S-box-containing protein